MFKKPILKTPNNCKEKKIITKPANNLKDWEFCSKVWPKKDADAPKVIKTIENKISEKTKWCS